MFYEKLNTTTDTSNIPERAVTFDTGTDVNVYDTVCLYCAENNINLENVTDVEFSATVDAIGNFKKQSRFSGYDLMAFWFE